MKTGMTNKLQAHRGSRMNRAVQVDAWLLIPVLLLVASAWRYSQETQPVSS